jgi:ubiquinone/menaquinone biosynthesis C-methylase UbiE
MKHYEKFWDRIAKRYARSPVADEDAYRAKLERTREYLTPQTKAFEFGCGTGSTAVYHAPYVQSILAIDVSRNMIDIARGKAEAKQLDNAHFEVGSIENVEVPDESYDIVMAHSILHLLKDKDAALGKAHAMLKPGGIFVSSTTCMGDSFATQAIGFGVAAVSFTGLLPYVNVFSTEQLVQSVTNTGFSIEHEWRPGKGKALFLIARRT